MGGQFDKTSRSITGKVTSLGKSVAGLAKKFTLLAGVAGIAAVGLAAKNAISTFTDFEKAIANAASVTGATGKVFEETKKHIEAVSRELGETTVFSASQAANAFYDLASAGYDVALMTKDELKPIMDLAAATQNDLTKTTEVVTSTLGQFGLKMKSSGRIADVFAKTIGSSKATIQALEYSLKYVGPVAKSMGMELEEVNAILGNLYNAGFKGEQAGTALRGAFSRLLNPTTAMTEQLMAMGLTLEDVDPTTRDFADILDTLKDAGIDTAGAMKLFGIEAAPAMLALTENTDGIRELEDALSDAGGTAETMATQQLDTLSGSIALLKSALEGMSITLGKALAPYVRAFAEWLTKMVPVVMRLGGEIKKKLTPAFNKLRDFLKDIIPRVKDLIEHFAQKLQPAFRSISKIAESLGKIFGGLTSDLGDSEDAFATLTSVVNVVADVLNWLAGVIEKVVNWFSEHPTITKFAIAIAAAIALISSPILAIIAALAVLAVAWDKDWLGIKTTTLKITGVISKAIENFLKFVDKLWDKYGDSILKTVYFVWDGIKLYIDLMMSTVRTIVKVAMALLKGDWEGAWDAIKKYVVKVGDAIGKFWDKWGKDIKKFFSDLWKKITTGVTDWAKDTLGVIGGWTVTSVNAYLTWSKDVRGTLIGWAKDTVNTFGGWAKDILSGLGDWVTNFSSDFSDWASDNISELDDWISDFVSDFNDWSSDVIEDLGDWASDFISDFNDWSRDILSDLATWISDFKSDFSDWASDALSVLRDWAKDAIQSFSNWASDVLDVLSGWISDSIRDLVDWADSIVGTNGVLTGWFNDVLDFFYELMNIDFKWPEIPNPFEGIDFCKYIPVWLQKWMGICDQIQETPVLPNVVDPFVNTFDTVTNAVGAAKGWGVSIAGNLASGLVSGTGAISSAVRGINAVIGGIGGGTGGTGGTTPQTPSEVRGIKVNDVRFRGGAAGASGRWMGEFWSGSTQDPFDEWMRSERTINPVWLTQTAWNSLSQDMQAKLTNSITGVVSDDYTKVLTNFSKPRSTWTIGTGPDIPPSGLTFADGGEVPITGSAMVHKGEFVVPKAGALVLNNHPTTPNIVINNKYDIGNVYGVNDLQRILDIHDRKIVKKLEALV